MNEIKTFPCGITVKPKLHNTEAIITCVSMRFGKIQYELSYFYNGEYKVIWMAEEEFVTLTDEKTTIGFK